MKQYFEIVDVTAREVVGLKYEPTVEVEITLDDETVGRASVPAGMKNAREISIAVDNVNMEISTRPGFYRQASSGDRRNREHVQARCKCAYGSFPCLCKSCRDILRAFFV